MKSVENAAAKWLGAGGAGDAAFLGVAPL